MCEMVYSACVKVVLRFMSLQYRTKEYGKMSKIELILFQILEERKIKDLHDSLFKNFIHEFLYLSDVQLMDYK
ncbi:hypothetical protein BpHYR1_000215 [Brachionus plicatilis]|uniref:Uncharacterized protein n=1 Tax=Brachionus plicatilis TaxID=10195 RepID=A0A3M7SDB0_BRAPC|nr:hypothetical protein BpHYR1_000215 [Brachionus plicatilis]